jgi:hypothetical protein
LKGTFLNRDALHRIGSISTSACPIPGRNIARWQGF